MNKLDINTSSKSCPIYIREQYDDFINCFEPIYSKHTCILLTDKTVEQHQGRLFEDMLQKNRVSYKKLVLEGGEVIKSFERISEVYDFLYDSHVDRNTVMITLGGGVIGDLGGFAASTYLRGIPYINVPTSLIAQIDSSMGGKTGVNFRNKKNLIGAFYQPEFIYSNIRALETLSERHFRSGLAECLCHALIDSQLLFDFMRNNTDALLKRKVSFIKTLVEMNCCIKKKFVEQDEYDRGSRMLLNLGHTFGHAIESSYDFRFTHGECVALGIICALHLSRELEMIKEDEAESIIQLIRDLGLPASLQKEDKHQIFENMFYDKKIKRGKLCMIIPKKIGEVTAMEIEQMDLISNAINKIYY